MLRGSVKPSNHRHLGPGGVAAGKEFCSRAIPGPGPSQNPALLGTPAPKVHTPYNHKRKRTGISRLTVASCRHVQHSCGSPSRQRSCVSKNCHTTFAVRSPRCSFAVLNDGWAVPAQVPEAVCPTLPPPVFTGVWEPVVSQTLRRQSPPALPHQTASGTNTPLRSAPLVI